MRLTQLIHKFIIQKFCYSFAEQLEIPTPYLLSGCTCLSFNNPSLVSHGEFIQFE